MNETALGLRVWYHAKATDTFPGAKDGPLAGIITKIHGPGRVNLCIFDANGLPSAKINIPFVDAGVEVPAGGGFASWPTDAAGKPLVGVQELAGAGR